MVKRNGKDGVVKEYFGDDEIYNIQESDYLINMEENRKKKEKEEK